VFGVHPKAEGHKAFHGTMVRLKRKEGHQEMKVMHCYLGNAKGGKSERVQGGSFV